MTVPSVVYALLMNAGAIGFVFLVRGMEDDGGARVKVGG